MKLSEVILFHKNKDLNLYSEICNFIDSKLDIDYLYDSGYSQSDIYDLILNLFECDIFEQDCHEIYSVLYNYRR